MAHPLQQKKLLISVARADVGLDGDTSLAEGFCTMVAGPVRCTTRTVNRSKTGSLVWGSGSGAELFMLTEDDLLVTELRLGFEVWNVTRKWGGDTQYAQADLQLGEHILEQLLAGCTADVRLPLTEPAKGRTWTGAAKPSSTDAIGMLLLHMHLQPADADVDSGLCSQLPVENAPRLLVDSTPLAPGTVLHCSQGVLYSEPCYVYIRFKLVAATGLGRSTQPMRPAGSKGQPSELTASLAAAATGMDLAPNRGGGTLETPVAGSPAVQRLSVLGSNLQNQAVTALGKAQSYLAGWKNRGAKSSAGVPPSARSSNSGMNWVEGGNGGGGWGLVPGRASANDGLKDDDAANDSSGSSWDQLQPSGVATPVGQSPPSDGVSAPPGRPGSPKPSSLLGGPAAEPTPFAAISTTVMATDASGETTAVQSHGSSGNNTMAIPPPRTPTKEQLQGGSGGRSLESAKSGGSIGSSISGAPGTGVVTKSGVLKAEAMLAALEENGFAVADSKVSAAFFWCKVSYEGQYHTTRMVPVDNGTATWGETFVVAALRPITNAPLEVELSGSNDAKTRGKVICQLSAPLNTLMAQPSGPKCPLGPVYDGIGRNDSAETDGSSNALSYPAVGSSGTGPSVRHLPDYHPNRWPRGTITLQTKVEDRTCEVLFEVDVVEPDLRGHQAGVPLMPKVEVRESSSSMVLRTPSQHEAQAHKAADQKAIKPDASTDPISPTKAGSVPGDVELRTLAPSKPPAAPLDSSSVSSPLADAPGTSVNALSTALYTDDGIVARSAAAVVASAAGTVAAVASSAAEVIGLPVPASPGSPMPGMRAPYSPVATLALIVHEFEVERLDPTKPPQKPTANSDYFFMLQCGNIWGCSTTVTAAATAAWQWGMLLPLAHPSSLLSLALFKRHDQAAGKKVLNMKTMMGNTQDLVGKLRIRSSTLVPHKVVTVSMPIWGERNGTRAGVRMGRVQLSLCLSYPALAPYLNAYLQVPDYMSVVMLQNGAIAGRGPCDLLPPEDKCSKVEAETLQRRNKRVILRWLEECNPAMPVRSARRLMDDGRQEFNLTRTQQNWRRVSRAMAATKPMTEWWLKVQMWDNPLLTLAVACVEVCLVVWPSKVISILLLALVAWTWQHKNHLDFTMGEPPCMVEDLTEEDDNMETSTGGFSNTQQQQALTHEDSMSSSGGVDTGPAGTNKNAAPEVPLDPFNALKQNYDGLVLFMISVQNALDGFATTLEKIQALLSWQDPFATALWTAGLVFTAVMMWHMQLRWMVGFALLFDIRPRMFRWPLPPPPANIVAYLPNRADLMM